MIIRPRLSDYYNIPLLQSEVDFAIPFMDEDIPLYVDPFLMWKSPSQMDNMLHDGVLNAFNNLGRTPEGTVIKLTGTAAIIIVNLFFKHIKSEHQDHSELSNTHKKQSPEGL